jgi:hypothetical protein
MNNTSKPFRIAALAPAKPTVMGQIGRGGTTPNPGNRIKTAVTARYTSVASVARSASIPAPVWALVAITSG